MKPPLLKHVIQSAAMPIYVFFVFGVFFCSCSAEKPYKPESWTAEQIKGAWQGEVSHTRMFESKLFSPMIEDSITKMVDSVYVIKNVTVDFGKEQAHFYGVKNTVASSYLYTLDKGILLFKTIPSQDSFRGRGMLVVFGSVNDPQGAIEKLDGDSLILDVNAYKNDKWVANRFKLKRKRSL